jgi:pimeloyl-ACP methyl ester carboxylesterase
LFVHVAPHLPFVFRSATGRRTALKIAVAHGDRMSADAALAFVEDLAECTIWRPLKKWFVSTEHTLGTIDCPVRIASCELDALIPLEPYGARFRTLAPGADFRMLRDVGHVPMYDDPELVIRTILELSTAVDDSGHKPA